MKYNIFILSGVLLSTIFFLVISPFVILILLTKYTLKKIDTIN